MQWTEITSFHTRETDTRFSEEHWPATQKRPSSHVPQLPPQPSSPQLFPLQSG